MGKIRKLIAAIILIATLGGATMFGACTTDEGDAPVTDEPTKLEYGFSSSEGAPLPSQFCAYKSDKNIFEMDDVTLTFYFGKIFPTNDYNVAELRKNTSIPKFDVYFADENYEPLYMIRHSDENFISKEYEIKLYYNESLRVTEYLFNHSETVTIPKELFTDRYGEIRFCVAGIDVMRENSSYGPFIIRRLFYEIKNDKVVLSAWDNHRN